MCRRWASASQNSRVSPSESAEHLGLHSRAEAP